MESLLKDLRFGLRQLRLNPIFTLVAILSLALGIGANSAVFQIIDALRLEQLPVKNPRELAVLDFGPNAHRSGNWSTRSARFTYDLWTEIRRRQDAFTDVIAWSAQKFNLSTGGEARYAEGLFVSGNFFSMLGVPPVAGRTFAGADDAPGCGTPGAVISYAFWQREFAGDPAIAGRTIRLDNLAFPILGVTSPNFASIEAGHRYDVAIPICSEPQFSANGKGRIASRREWWLSIMGRLQPGWTIDRAQTRFSTLAPGLMEATLPPSYVPEDAQRFLRNKLVVTEGATGVSELRGYFGNPLWMLLAATALVLLIACANLANLLLARAGAREREIAVRQAMGASRWRLISQLLSESLLLAIFGSIAGALLAQIVSRGLLAAVNRKDNALFLDLGLNWQMLGFMTAIGVVTCLLFGLAPALRATRVDPIRAMRSRGAAGARESFSLRRVLVAGQVALSLVLLMGALLFVESLRKLATVDTGFRAEGIVAVDIDLRPGHYAKDRMPLVYRDLLEKMRALPGVTSAAQAGWLPVAGDSWDESVWADGSRAPSQTSYFNTVGPHYFATMGIGMLAGRDFDERDRVGSPDVAIVNEAFARKIFGGENPVGRAFRVKAPAGKQDQLYQVIGLVRNAKYTSLRENFIPVVYEAPAQDSDPGPHIEIVVRTSAALANLDRAATAAIAQVNPSFGIEFTVLTEQLKDSLNRERLMATLASAFAVVAGLLAAIGLYGVIAYMVARRRNEIGVRVALGADRARIMRLVLREAAMLLIIGLPIGAGLSIAAGRATASMLYGLKPYDAPTMLAAVALLGVVAIAASYIPARRAARLDPMTALREE
jgi:putative ABC transport system permease protein